MGRIKLSKGKEKEEKYEKMMGSNAEDRRRRGLTENVR